MPEPHVSTCPFCGSETQSVDVRAGGHLVAVVACKNNCTGELGAIAPDYCGLVMNKETKERLVDWLKEYKPRSGKELVEGIKI